LQLSALLESAQRAAPRIARLPEAQNQALLHALADHVLAETPDILAANALDLAQMADTDPKKDRLLLDASRLRAIAESIRAVAALPRPAGRVLSERTLPNGIWLRKMAVPLGVVGIIYESRPNVTLDVTALCLRSGNAAVLRGGSEAWHSNQALLRVIHRALAQQGLPAEAVTLLPTDRALLPELLRATRWVDVLIPRGSDALIRFVRENALVPVIETGAGVCHTYVHAAADPQKALRIVVNAKVTRPSVCNALDTVLVDRAAASNFLPLLPEALAPWKVEIFADPAALALLQPSQYPYLSAAGEGDFGREFLDYKCSVRVVDGLEEALEHIRRHSSRHSEAIVSEDADACQHFLDSVDAAAVYANASTRFTDGGEFGLGAEIGISTQKLHARGPFALEKLVTEKWVAIGNGQVRE
jgi:glutamate-5-semialdehyde dehydrogenase